MNFFDILSQIENLDPELSGRIDSRRSVFKHMGGLGQKLGAAALPLAVGAIFNKAYAQTPVGAGVNDVLNFALKLEYLESYFYNARTGVTSQMSSVNAAGLALIATDEANHVSFLRSVLGSAAIRDPTMGAFDYTAQGIFPTALTNANTYLAIAQSFEDLGVRAYKGAAPLVMSNKTVLTAALSIHAVEARHASHIRAMRRAGATSNSPSQGIPSSQYDTNPKSWISGTDNGGPAPRFTLPIYVGGSNTNAPAGIDFLTEENTTQGGVNLRNLPNTSTFTASSFSEAFDEGLDVGTVARIANNFSVSGNYFG